WVAVDTHLLARKYHGYDCQRGGTSGYGHWNGAQVQRSDPRGARCLAVHSGEVGQRRGRRPEAQPQRRCRTLNLKEDCSPTCDERSVAAQRRAVPEGTPVCSAFLPGTAVPGFPVTPLRGWLGRAFHVISVCDTSAPVLDVDRPHQAGTAMGRIWIRGALLLDMVRGLDSPCCSMFAVGTPVR